MRHGFINFTHMGSSIYFWIFMFILAIWGVIYLSKGSSENSENDKLIEIINKRLHNHEISIEEFDEIEAILEKEESIEPAIMIIKERYAHGDLNLDEFNKMKNNIDIENSERRYANLLELKNTKGEITINVNQLK